MTSSWKIASSQWGLSLFFDGALVASAREDTAGFFELVELAAVLTADVGEAVLN